MVTVGNVRRRMLDIVQRGGRIVVLDPRRTETAELFEHVPIRPASDAFLLAAMLKVIFDEGLEDRAALALQTVGFRRPAAARRRDRSRPGRNRVRRAPANHRDARS